MIFWAPVGLGNTTSRVQSSATHTVCLKGSDKLITMPAPVLSEDYDSYNLQYAGNSTPTEALPSVMVFPVVPSENLSS